MLLSNVDEKPVNSLLYTLALGSETYDYENDIAQYTKRSVSEYIKHLFVFENFPAQVDEREEIKHDNDLLFSER